MKFLGYLFFWICALISIKFIIEVINEKIENKNLKSIIVKSFISSVFAISAIVYIDEHVLKNIELINRYSSIHIYILLHLLFEFSLCTILAFIILFIMLESSDGILFSSKKQKAKTTNYTFRNTLKLNSKVKIVINFINKNINPLYTINFKNINIIKLIKKIFIFNYLIAGVIMLSPVTNYINEKFKESNIDNATYESFKNDYELYKDVFFIGLIPYSLTYIFKK